MRAELSGFTVDMRNAATTPPTERTAKITVVIRQGPDTLAVGGPSGDGQPGGSWRARA